MMTRKGLGRGLNALLDLNIVDDGTKKVDINEIEPDLDQPRKSFDQGKLKDLAESIKKHGIIQPIIVKKSDNCYKIVAGERRWRAAKLAGITDVPVLVKDLSSKEMKEIALIENIQREDLNVIEEAYAFKELIEKYNLTQEELSKLLGRSRVAITNTIRLIKLGNEAKEALVQKKILEGHARLLITLKDEKVQKAVLKTVIEKKMTVRELEKYLKALTKSKAEKSKNKSDRKEKNINIEKLEEKIQEKLGTKVSIKNNKNDKGSILIEYYSKEELERIANFFN